MRNHDAGTTADSYDAKQIRCVYIEYKTNEEAILIKSYSELIICRGSIELAVYLNESSNALNRFSSLSAL